MFILIGLYLFTASRGFLLTYSLIDSIATSGVGSSGIGDNSIDPLRTILPRLEALPPSPKQTQIK